MRDWGMGRMGGMGPRELLGTGCWPAIIRPDQRNPLQSAQKHSPQKHNPPVSSFPTQNPATAHAPRPTSDSNSTATISLHAVALRILFRFSVQRKMLERDTLQFLGVSKIERYLPETLSEPEIARYLEAGLPELVGRKTGGVVFFVRARTPTDQPAHLAFAA